jgi:hypothetical protein
VIAQPSPLDSLSPNIAPGVTQVGPSAPPGVAAGIPIEVRGLGVGTAVRLDVEAVGGLSRFSWLVPAVIVGLPGLLILLVALGAVRLARGRATGTRSGTVGTDTTSASGPPER